MPIYLKCLICKKSFFIYPRTLKDKHRGKFCSVVCSAVGRQNRTTKTCFVCKKIFSFPKSQLKFTKRKYCSKKCFGQNNRSKKNYLWKGKKASYRVQHRWIELRFGKASKCSNKKCKHMSNRFEWANISGKYLRSTKDYMSLCKFCHKAFDGGKILKKLRK